MTPPQDLPLQGRWQKSALRNRFLTDEGGIIEPLRPSLGEFVLPTAPHPPLKRSPLESRYDCPRQSWLLQNSLRGAPPQRGRRYAPLRGVKNTFSFIVNRKLGIRYWEFCSNAPSQGDDTTLRRGTVAVTFQKVRYPDPGGWYRLRSGLPAPWLLRTSCSRFRSGAPR